MFYNARYYDPALGTFISPDSMVPNPASVIDHNRFLYARGNPLKYTDPTGHQGYDPVGHDWVKEFKEKHGVYPTPQDRIDRLVSITDPGPATGKRTWDDTDWERYWYLSAEEKIYAEIRADPFGWLVRQMRANAQDPRVRDIAELTESHPPVHNAMLGVWYTDSRNPLDFRSYKIWIGLVATGAEWDYKGTVETAFQEDFCFHEGRGYRFDIWGNINYGYVGRAAGFSAHELRGGAGWAQIRAGTWRGEWFGTNFDDPIDQAAINLGIELYEENQLNINRAILIEALAQEKWSILSVPEK